MRCFGVSGTVRDMSSLNTKGTSIARSNGRDVELDGHLRFEIRLSRAVSRGYLETRDGEIELHYAIWGVW